MEAAGQGRYTYCFSNEMSTYARKILRYVCCLPVGHPTGQPPREGCTGSAGISGTSASTPSHPLSWKRNCGKESGIQVY